MKYTYLLVNIFSVIVPFIFSFHPKLRFDKFFKAYFSANIISAICFMAWDSFFVSKGIWGFNNDYILGIEIFHLPIEEILFFFCIPFACIFTYHCITKFYKIEWNRKFENGFILFLSFGLLIIGLIHFDKSYTSATFISTGLMLLCLKFVFKVDWLPKIFSVYLILLIPFFIVNGILTGYFTEKPVVWYNNAENLHIRLLSIPIEDVFYGFELIILTIFIYEKLKTVFYKSKNLHHENIKSF